LEAQGFAVAAVCQALGVSRAGYYAHARGDVGLREPEDARLRPLVQHVFWEHTPSRQNVATHAIVRGCWTGSKETSCNDFGAHDAIAGAKLDEGLVLAAAMSQGLWQGYLSSNLAGHKAICRLIRKVPRRLVASHNVAV
jgi:hypothetical protein